MALIRVEHLTKEFRRQKQEAGFWGTVRALFSRDDETIVAVNDISFEIERGEIVGYIGPNGAGKSTTIKMLVGVLVPTSGCVEVAGLVPYQNRVKNARHIGVVFGQRIQLWWDLPVSESLGLTRHMYGVSQRDYRANMDLLSDVLGMDELLHVPVRQLSLGQRMRAELCNALLHNPDVLFLDEPTIGLDVEVKERIRQFIRAVNCERSTTVVLTTHDMSDVEKLCSRVIVIDHGRLMFDGRLDQLKQDYGADEKLIVDTDQPVTDLGTLRTMGVTDIAVDGTRLTLQYDRREVNSADVLGYLMEQHKVLNFVVRETETEAVIRNLYQANASLNQTR